MNYYDKNDQLADASTYEERQAVLRGPSFHFLQAEMEREAAKDKRRDARQRKQQAKQSRFSFA